jgi:hypothetical protein
MNLSNNEAAPNFKNLLVIMVTILITALVVGGMVSAIYTAQQKNFASSEKMLKQELVLMQNQITQMQQETDKEKQLLVEEVVVQPDMEQDATEDKLAKDILYTNEKYDFSLTFPATWQGYTVSEPGTDGTICFSVTEAGDQPLCILQLYVLPNSQPVSVMSILLGRTDEWKIVTSNEITCVQLSDSQCARKHEVLDILKTFKLNK